MKTRVEHGKLTIERVYVITSLNVFDATPAELAPWIENLLHHVCNPTFREDDSKVRTGRLARLAPWPAYASWPSASSGRTATPTSPPPSGPGIKRAEEVHHVLRNGRARCRPHVRVSA